MKWIYYEETRPIKGIPILAIACVSKEAVVGKYNEEKDRIEGVFVESTNFNLDRLIVDWVDKYVYCVDKYVYLDSLLDLIGDTDV